MDFHSPKTKLSGPWGPVRGDWGALVTLGGSDARSEYDLECKLTASYVLERLTTREVVRGVSLVNARAY